MSNQVNIQLTSKTQEHYTPFEIIKAARETLGEIDLDPASSHEANLLVEANKIYTQTDNSLEKEWIAETIFLNPPGGKVRNKSLQALFADKLLVEYNKGNVNSAIFLAFSLELLPKRLWLLDFPICFVGVNNSQPGCISGSGRIKFDTVNEDGKRVQQKSPTHGNFIVLLPRDLRQVIKFKAEFSCFGVFKEGSKVK